MLCSAHKPLLQPMTSIAFKQVDQHLTFHFIALRPLPPAQNKKTLNQANMVHCVTRPHTVFAAPRLCSRTSITEQLVNRGWTRPAQRPVWSHPGQHATIYFSERGKIHLCYIEIDQELKIYSNFKMSLTNWVDRNNCHGQQHTIS